MCHSWPAISGGWHRGPGWCCSTGWGRQSDRLPSGTQVSPEDAAADIAAVVAAVGGEEVAIYATADGALAAITFAARHPELVTHLALWAASPRLRVSEDYPIGLADDAIPAPGPLPRWGDRDRPQGARAMAPSLADDPVWLASVARMQRLAGSPAVAGRLMQAIFDTDVRRYVSRIRCPTLVMHARGDRLYPVDHGRWIADHIEGSTWKPFEGSDHFYFQPSAVPAGSCWPTLEATERASERWSIRRCTPSSTNWLPTRQLRGRGQRGRAHRSVGQTRTSARIEAARKRLDRADAPALGIDTDHISYRHLAEPDTATDTARRDARPSRCASCDLARSQTAGSKRTPFEQR
jgi:pimeloyl-ACP methyl ester carboxylesterase